jgi:hypothetical protein
VALAEGRSVLLTQLRSPELKRSTWLTCIKDGEALPLPARSSEVLQAAVAMNFNGDGEVQVSAPCKRIGLRINDNFVGGCLLVANKAR